MSDLVVIAFPSEEKAEAVRTRVLGLQKTYLIELEDVVVEVKHPDGKVKLNQMVSTTAAGVASGSFWGLLIGVLFGADRGRRARGSIRCTSRSTAGGVRRPPGLKSRTSLAPATGEYCPPAPKTDRPAGQTISARNVVTVFSSR